MRRYNVEKAVHVMIEPVLAQDNDVGSGNIQI
jgi:hypothetical protein